MRTTSVCGDFDPAYPGLVARGRLQVGSHQFGQPLGEQPHQVVDTVRIRLVHEPDRPVTGGQGLGSLPVAPRRAPRRATQRSCQASMPVRNAHTHRAAGCRPRGGREGCVGREDGVRPAPQQASPGRAAAARRNRIRSQRRSSQRSRRSRYPPDRTGGLADGALQDRVPAVVLLRSPARPASATIKQDGQRRTRPDQADDTSRAHRRDRAGTERCGADVRGGLPRLRE